MRTCLVIGVILLATGVLARANIVTYGSFDGGFTDPSLWWDPTAGTNRVPDANDIALLFSGATPIVWAGTSPIVGNLYLGEWCQTGLPHNSIQPMIIEGSLNVLEGTNIGCLSGSSPTLRGHLTINSGGSFISSHIITGQGNNGTITMNGGNLTARWWIGLGCNAWANDDVNTPGIGTINLNAGTVQTNQLFMGSDSSQIIITDGVVLLNYSARIASYLANNQIVAASGYTVNVDYSYNMGFGARIFATRSLLQGDLNISQTVDLDDLALFAGSWLDGTD